MVMKEIVRCTEESKASFLKEVCVIFIAHVWMCIHIHITHTIKHMHTLIHSVCNKHHNSLVIYSAHLVEIYLKQYATFM